MSKRKSMIDYKKSKIDDKSEIDDKSKVDDLRSHIAATSQASKAGIARVLNALQSANVLTDIEIGKSVRSERYQLQKAVHRHAKADTPYGCVVQSMDIGLDRPWEFIHPFALIYYLSSISKSFSSFFHDAVVHAHGKLRLLVYADEFTPGNPNRIDQGRMVMCYYFTFIDFPTWAVNQTIGWLPFGMLRSRKIEQSPLSSSSLLSKVLMTFLSDEPSTGIGRLDTGCMYVHGGEHRMYSGTFAGIIGDEKGLKEFFGIKGQAGWKPCLSCTNVHNFLHKESDIIDGNRLQSWEVFIDEIDRNRFKSHTNASAREMFNRVNNAQSKGERDNLRMIFGVNHCPEGIVSNPRLRNIVLPVDHYIRDWQHTLCAHGVIGSFCAGLFAALKENRVPWSEIAEFSSLCRFPKSQKKFDKEVFSKKYITEESVKTFASQTLQMLPIVFAFLAAHRARLCAIGLNRHIDCMGHMLFIVSSLQQCKDFNEHIATIVQSRVDAWASLYKELFPESMYYKIKFHHFVAHLIDDLRKMGKVIGCFATERKHKDVKVGMLHAFSDVEFTTTTSFLNSFIDGCTSDTITFEPRALINPSKCESGYNRSIAKKAKLEIGELAANDVIIAVYENRKIVGSIVRFVESDSRIKAEIHKYRHVRDYIGTSIVSDWQIDLAQIVEVVEIDASAIVAAPMWAHRSKHIILVVEPAML